MEVCGSDFTNTFRALSSISKSAELTPTDLQTIEKIASFSAPLEGLLKQIKAPFEDNPKVIQILKVNPDLLRMFG